MNMKKQVFSNFSLRKKVGIIGASGYTGYELIKLIKQFINNPESFHTKMRELTDYVFGQYTDRPSSPDIVGVGGELLRDRIERERG